MTDIERYHAAAHAMQSGVKAEIDGIVSDAHTPKHLRVGVNSAMCDTAALAGLLIAKGIITSDEYVKAIADQMEKEKKDYEERLSKYFGREITLV